MNTENNVTFIQLGRAGDILSMLPIVRKYHLLGHSTGILVSNEFGSLIDGLSYVKRIPWDGGVKNVSRAIEYVRPMGGKVIVTQVDANPIPISPGKNFIQQQWSRAGCLEEFHSLELVLDNRNPADEKILVGRLVGPDTRPVMLVSLNGHSAPYHHWRQMFDHLTNKWSRDFKLIDISNERAKRIQDLLGLFECASVLVTIDTATLHLGYASKTPTIALVPDREWYASEPHSHWIARVTYSDSITPSGHDAIDVAVRGVLDHCK